MKNKKINATPEAIKIVNNLRSGKPQTFKKGQEYTDVLVALSKVKGQTVQGFHCEYEGDNVTMTLKKTPLVVKESDSSSLTISDMVTVEKGEAISFEIKALYFEENEPRVAQCWVNKKQAKQIIEKLQRFISE